MHVCISVKAYASRLQDLCRIRRKKKQVLKISAPFNFTKEESIIPGISDDEISILREKAAASRIGIADFRSASPGHHHFHGHHYGLGLHHSHTYAGTHHHHQRRPLLAASPIGSRRGGSLCLNPVDATSLPGSRTLPSPLGGSGDDYSSVRGAGAGGARACRCGGNASEASSSPAGSFVGSSFSGAMLEKEMSL